MILSPLILQEELLHAPPHLLPNENVSVKPTKMTRENQEGKNLWQGGSIHLKPALFFSTSQKIICLLKTYVLDVVEGSCEEEAYLLGECCW